MQEMGKIDFKQLLCLDPSKSYRDDIASEISQFTGESIKTVKEKMKRGSELGRDLWNVD